MLLDEHCYCIKFFVAVIIIVVAVNIVATCLLLLSCRAMVAHRYINNVDHIKTAANNNRQSHDVQPNGVGQMNTNVAQVKWK